MMEQPQQADGVALSCDLQGKILQVISDGLGLTGKDTAGMFFTQLVAERDAGRAVEFLQAISERGNVFDWELTTQVGYRNLGLHFVGTKSAKSILIMAAGSRSELIRFCWGLGKSQVIHAEALQDTLFGFALQPESAKVIENYRPEDFTRPGSELVTLRQELARAKAEIKTTEELFSGLFDQMAVGVCYSDLSGKLIRFNRRFGDIIGYSVQELAGRHFREITHPDDIDKDLQNLQDLLGGKIGTFSVEKRYLHKNGSIVWVNLTVSKMVNQDGESLHFIAVSEDITERKQVEHQLGEAHKELEKRVKERTSELERTNQRLNAVISERQLAAEAHRQSEEKYRRLFEIMDQGVIYVDANGRITLANPAAEEMMGMTLGQMQGSQASDPLWHAIHEDGSVFPPDSFPAEVALKTGKEVGATTMGVFNPIKNQVHWLSVSAVPYFIPGENAPHQVFVTIEDITVRRQAEEALAEKEEKYRQLFELGSDAVFLIDNLTYDIKEVNGAAEDMYGYSRDEFLSMKITDVSAEVPETKKTIGIISQTVKGKITVMERQHHRKDGTIMPVEISARNFTGSMRGLHVAAIRDISERKRAEEKIRLQLERLKGLKEIDHAINTDKRIEVTLGLVLDQAAMYLGVDACRIMLLNKEENSLVCKAARGLDNGDKGQGCPALDEGRTWQVVNGRRPVHYHIGDEVTPTRQDEEFPYYWGFPLVTFGKVKGVLEVYAREGPDQESDWPDYLEALAGQAAIAVDHFELFEGLKRANSELISSYDDTIAGWAKALELRDEETKGHADRVTSISLHLAREMGMTEEELVHFHRGVFLHDIGKMGIPDEILLKKGPLSPEEWVIMRRHPDMAWQLLKDIPFLRPALDIPYCHHEKWDGSGYPRGLKGEEIPLGARIFAIVDVWDALMSDRPYRPAWSFEKVREYIGEQSGIHFDPQLVEVFYSMLDKALPEDGL